MVTRYFVGVFSFFFFCALSIFWCLKTEWSCPTVIDMRICCWSNPRNKRRRNNACLNIQEKNTAVANYCRFDTRKYSIRQRSQKKHQFSRFVHKEGDCVDNILWCFCSSQCLCFPLLDIWCLSRLYSTYSTLPGFGMTHIVIFASFTFHRLSHVIFFLLHDEKGRYNLFS